MTVFSVIAVYFVVWWVVLFAVLAVRRSHAAGSRRSNARYCRQRAGASAALRVAIATTILAGVIVGGMWVAVNVYGVSLESFANLLDAKNESGRRADIKKARPSGLAHRVPRPIPSFQSPTDQQAGWTFIFRAQRQLPLERARRNLPPKT